ncbi:MAG: hypothetical protein ACRC16_22075 [Aeromonas salmonicida]
MLKRNEKLAGKNRYCGPAALAGIFGVCTDKAAELIRRESGQFSVKGSYTQDLLAAIRRHGGDVVPGRGMGGQHPWQIARGAQLTLIVVDPKHGYFEGHFALVHRGKMLDSFSREWVPVNQHIWRNAPIMSAYVVNKVPRLPKPRKRTQAETKRMLKKNITAIGSEVARTMRVRVESGYPIGQDDVSYIEGRIREMKRLLRLLNKV